MALISDAYGNYKALEAFREGTLLSGRASAFWTCLCHTFAYFERNGELEEGFSEKYTRIAEKALIIGNMVLKLYIKYREETAVLLLRHMEEMMEEEQAILHRFLDRQPCS